jgi:ribosome-binding factor A
VKFTPTLAFQPDEIPETARDLEDLLAKARAADEELQRKAAEAEYAGEPDPYKAPREDDDALDEAENEAEIAAEPEPAAGPVPPRAQR